MFSTLYLKMKRILILGCCGAGKSTFARALHEKTGLEVIHLDQLYWKPNWTETEPEEWRTIIEQEVEKPSWIMDGNYGGTIDIRIAKADTIFYLDYSTAKCLYRVCKRIIKHYGSTRPDMTGGCPERFDLEFLHYVAVFNIVKRKGLLHRLKEVEHEKQCVIFRNDREADQFLHTLS